MYAEPASSPVLFDASSNQITLFEGPVLLNGKPLLI